MSSLHDTRSIGVTNPAAIDDGEINDDDQNYIMEKGVYDDFK